MFLKNRKYKSYKVQAGVLNNNDQTLPDPKLVLYV